MRVFSKSKAFPLNGSTWWSPINRVSFCLVSLDSITKDEIEFGATYSSFEQCRELFCSGFIGIKQKNKKTPFGIVFYPIKEDSFRLLHWAENFLSLESSQYYQVYQDNTSSKQAYLIIPNPKWMENTVALSILLALVRTLYYTNNATIDNNMSIRSICTELSEKRTTSEFSLGHRTLACFMKIMSNLDKLFEGSDLYSPDRYYSYSSLGAQSLSQGYFYCGSVQNKYRELNKHIASTKKQKDVEIV